MSMNQFIWGLITACVMFILFATFIIWIEHNSLRQIIRAKKEAKIMLESGEISGIENFEHVCRALQGTHSSLLSIIHEDKEATELFKRLQDLKHKTVVLCAEAIIKELSKSDNSVVEGLKQYDIVIESDEHPFNTSSQYTQYKADLYRKLFKWEQLPPADILAKSKYRAQTMLQ